MTGLIARRPFAVVTFPGKSIGVEMAKQHAKVMQDTVVSLIDKNWTTVQSFHISFASFQQFICIDHDYVPEPSNNNRT